MKNPLHLQLTLKAGDIPTMLSRNDHHHETHKKKKKTHTHTDVWVPALEQENTIMLLKKQSMSAKKLSTGVTEIRLIFNRSKYFS
jgi:hypothetical protein